MMAFLRSINSYLTIHQNYFIFFNSIFDNQRILRESISINKIFLKANRQLSKISLKIGKEYHKKLNLWQRSANDFISTLKGSKKQKHNCLLKECLDLSNKISEEKQINDFFHSVFHYQKLKKTEKERVAEELQRLKNLKKKREKTKEINLAATPLPAASVWIARSVRQLYLKHSNVNIELINELHNTLETFQKEIDDLDAIIDKRLFSEGKAHPFRRTNSKKYSKLLKDMNYKALKK